MLKKIVAILLVLAIIITLVIIIGPFSDEKQVQAATTRNGFELIPEKHDQTGISLDTTFMLTIDISKNMSIDELVEAFYIEGEEKPVIENVTEGSFRITPAKAFYEGKVYTFGINEKDGTKTTWAFQTSTGLKIIASFPADQSTYVPVNTGIEIYFNQAKFENYIDNFEISPYVEGEFEVHKNVLVFVPQKLEVNKIYTVTVKSGVNIENTDIALTEDHVFYFATAPDEETNNPDYDKGYFIFSRQLTEYSSKEDLLVPSYYYFSKSQKEATFTVDTKVFAFDNIVEFKDAYEKGQLVPYWARGSIMIKNTYVDDLKLVLSKTFELPVEQRSDEDRYLNFGKDLSKGYYLIQAELNGNITQTFIQITDIAVFVMNTETGYFIWVKDLISSQNIENAMLSFDEGEKYYTDNNGSILTKIDNTSESNMAILSSIDDALIINLYDYEQSSYRYYNRSSDYWNIVQTDRGLYKPDDTVSFFGFIKQRNTDKTLSGDLTIELSRGGFYPYYSSYFDYSMKGFYYPGISDPMLKQTVEVNSSFFEGEIKLPSLAEGSYTLVVKNGDEIISSTYVNIENYTKPAYTLELTKIKRAIFIGETIEFDLQSSFFEGTPVSNLEFRVDIGNSFGGEYVNINETTDLNGKYTLQYTPTQVHREEQGMQWGNISVFSSTPEMGEIYINDNFYVFINDIWPTYDSVIENGRGKLSIELNYVDLDNFNDNDGTYIGDPVPGKQITGKIFRNEYVRKKDGEYYDYINKVKRTTYRYERIVTIVDQFDLITDPKGNASFEFITEKQNNQLYYTAEITVLDSNGRTIKNSTYFYYNNRREQYYEEQYNDYSRLEISSENLFGIGDEVEITYLHLGEEVNGSYAYLLMQNGIKKIEFFDSSKYTFDYSESFMPNVNVSGVYFTGNNFEHVSTNVNFDQSERELIINAELDKESYRPGEKAVVNITAVDTKGAPVNAVINVAIVDEALFALNEQYIDTLADIFTYVGNGMKYVYTTHTLQQEFYGPVYSGRNSMDIVKGESEMETTAPSMERDEAGGADIRSDFKDTAFFKSVRLDETGMGSITIDLPDNITSWRVTMQGISEKIKAGSNMISLDVTMPMFINYSLSDVFLVGDRPYIGVSVYGTSLNENEIVDVRIEGEGLFVEAQTTAFERAYIPLDVFSEVGDFELTISAFSESGLSDGILHKYSVYDSYHEIDYVETLKAVKGMILPSGDAGLTTYIFSDSSTGKYAGNLYSLLYSRGNRIEQKVVYDTAAKLIKEYFNDEFEYDKLDVKEYQKNDGGIAFLPYGESDIFTTVMVLPYILDKIDKSMIKMYLYSVLDSAGQPHAQSAALYGLSLLNEPVLVKIKEYEKIVNQDIVDRIYTALAYANYNEIPEARRIFSQYVLDSITASDLNARLEFGDDLDERLKNTALTALLAAKIDLSEKEGLFNYISKEYSNEYLTMIEKLEYIRIQLENAEPLPAQIEYEYLGNKKTIEVGKYSRSITIPSLKASELKILSVKGDIDVSTAFKVKKMLTGTDSHLGINRQYINYSRPGKSITKNDIIKVKLSVSISFDALELGYEISDYLPSGLRAIENFNLMRNYNDTSIDHFYYGNSQGQKVTFSVYGSRKSNKAITIEYLARVVNPGTFSAEMPVIRSYNDKSIFATGISQTIDIIE